MLGFIIFAVIMFIIIRAIFKAIYHARQKNYIQAAGYGFGALIFIYYICSGLAKRWS